MRLLRTLAPLALVAALATACGSGSSSPPSPTSAPTGTSSSSLELRPVYARYAKGVPLGPEIPPDLVQTLSQQKCPTQPRDVQGMLLECDAGGTVYLLKDPIVSGGVTSATAKQIGHSKLWSVRITLDSSSTSTLDAATKTLTGTELAYSFGGTVVTSVIIGSSFDIDRLAVFGNYNQAQATKLASRIAGS